MRHWISLLCLLTAFAWAEDEFDPVFVSDTLSQRLETASQFRVAVMPMENVSLDPEVAYFFRQRAIELLIAKGYTVLGQEWIDSALYELGLTHAGQLRLLTPQQLSEVVKADGYLFGIVEEARSQKALAYNAYVYKSSMKMDDPYGENLWFSLEQRVSKRRFAADPINALLDIFLVNAATDAKEASAALANRLMASLPQGPVNVVIGDNLLDQAFEIETTDTAEAEDAQ